MGMDLFGQNPGSRSGEYFQENIWGWHPLWQYIEDQFPQFAAQVPNAHSNDGDGLNDVQSRALGFRLNHEINTGRALHYVVSHDQLEAVSGSESGNPWWVEKARGLVIAGGITALTQICQEPKELKAEMSKLIDHLSIKPFELSLPMIREFAEFLQHCGGFEIW
jgi:hypothetical protein